jgi:hypothetical protein
MIPGRAPSLPERLGTTDLGTIAKAALLLFGTAADKTTYEADVKAGLTKATCSWLRPARPRWASWNSTTQP